MQQQNSVVRINKSPISPASKFPKLNPMSNLHKKQRSAGDRLTVELVVEKRGVVMGGTLVVTLMRCMKKCLINHILSFCIEAQFILHPQYNCP